MRTLHRHSDVGPPRLWRLDRVTVEEDGQVLGQMTISYVPSDRYAALGKWSRLARALGNDSWRDLDPNESDAAWRHRLYEGLLKLQGWGPANAAVTASPTGPALRAQVEALADALLVRHAAQEAAFKAFHLDRPLVDYVQVEPAFRRQGLATQLYTEAARWLGEQGLVLHASRVQSPAAQALWATLTRNQQVQQDPQTRRRQFRPR